MYNARASYLLCVALAGAEGLSEETLREAILTLETKVVVPSL